MASSKKALPTGKPKSKLSPKNPGKVMPQKGKPVVKAKKA